MGKTVSLREDAYKEVVNKQTELLNKGIEMDIQDIVAEAVLLGIDGVGE